MSRVHVPVLAGELINLTAPAPGETAVDCTFGAGGHARLVADRLGPTGTLVCIDLDPGISSMQVDARERGFSYSYDAPLDMRMDPAQELDAREVVNTWDERRLAQVLRRYGEEPNAGRIAREIEKRRRRAPLETTGELGEAIEAAPPAAVRRSFG